MANILYIVGNPDATGGGEVLLKSRIESLGHTVTRIRGGDPEDTTGYDAVIISDSVGMSDVADKYDEDCPVPVVNMEALVWDVHGLTSQPVGGTFGTPASQMDILAVGHPLAAGLSGTVTVFSPEGRVDGPSQGGTSGDVVEIVKITGGSMVPLLAFEAGSILANGQTAAARRVAFGCLATSIADLTSDGWALVDAIIAWIVPQAPSFSWTVWNGTSEVALTQTLWDGTAEVAVEVDQIQT